MMTDRYNGLVVVLGDDIRSDDATALIAAIKQLRGVLSVVPNVANPGTTIAYERARGDIRRRLWEAFGEEGLV